MMISSNGKSITTNYKIESAQTGNESTAYFVLEHQPDHCSAYPADGKMTFSDIYMEVDGVEVKDAKWAAKQEQLQLMEDEGRYLCDLLAAGSEVSP
jgi:hypothetical protein